MSVITVEFTGALIGDNMPPRSKCIGSFLGVNKIYRNTSEAVEYSNLPCNGGNLGLTYLVIWSDNTNDGDSTGSAIYMLRCGYNGNHLSTTEIAKSGATASPTFTASQNGYIQITGSGKFVFIRYV